MPSSEAARTDHIAGFFGASRPRRAVTSSWWPQIHSRSPEPLSRMCLHKRIPETNNIPLTKPRSKHWQNRKMKEGATNIWEIPDYVNNVIQSDRALWRKDYSEEGHTQGALGGGLRPQKELIPPVLFGWRNSWIICLVVTLLAINAMVPLVPIVSNYTQYRKR